MPNFIWSVKDKQGKILIKEVIAETVEESKSMLLGEGYTEIELKRDDVMDASSQIYASFNKGRRSQPEELIKVRENLRQTTFKLILETIIYDKWLYAGMILLMILVFMTGRNILAIIVGIVTLSWLIFRIWLRLPEIYYVKLNKAKEWHKWNDVLRIAKKCEQVRSMHALKIPQTEIILSHAQALSGLGKLSEALDEFQQYENQPGVQSWLYKAQLASIYGIAKDYDMSIEYMWKAIKENPTPTLYLDLASRLLRYKKDVTKAREVLSEVEKSTMVDIARPYYLLYKGIIAYIEGDYDFSRKQIAESLKIAERNRNYPFRDALINIIYSYLCCVLAKLGDLNTAKEYFAKAKKYLIATGESNLLEECKRAIGDINL
jgi:tetratricopeptide (TPR) repeat protein